MNPLNILWAYVGIELIREILETGLATINRHSYQDPVKQAEAKKSLGISDEAFAKSLAYSLDRHYFGLKTSWFGLIVFLLFLAMGGFSLLEGWAKSLASLVDGGDITVGLAFFAILTMITLPYELACEYYATFVIEEKHGFNRQKVGSFFIDKMKMLVITCLLGVPLLAALMWVMQNLGSNWWVWAWLLVSGFSLVAAWLYPTLLAPLFNKFKPLDEGALKEKIFSFAKKVDFQTSGIFIMDASTRSSHGNAYFTGMFGKKRIVLFDTLVNSLLEHEIVAVLAHELGHFKLNHVRIMLIRSLLITGVSFYLLSLAMTMTSFYEAFSLTPLTPYATLYVFSLWFSTLGFFFAPIGSFFSRRNEFAADAFAKKHLGESSALVSALLKLRENNHAMPICHPLFSSVYHSHPPLLERLKTLKMQG